MGSLNQAIISHRRESKVRMASQMFKSLIDGVKQQLVPQFAKSATNINPHHRISTPRLRHFKKLTPRRLRLTKNMYSDKELALQSTAVSNYHASLDQRKQRQLKNRQNKLIRSSVIAGRREHKANKPTIVED
jgi:hypothetical protein